MKWWPWAGCTSWAPSGTRRAASTISLRGRAGRQGDPGSSRFFLSLEDDLLRIFGGERVKALMFRLGMTEGVPIESRLISKRIENAQKAVEAQNFEARKHLLEYDDVMNKQRETIYSAAPLVSGRPRPKGIRARARGSHHQFDWRKPMRPRRSIPTSGIRRSSGNELLNQFGFDLKTAER